MRLGKAVVLKNFKWLWYVILFSATACSSEPTNSHNLVGFYGKYVITGVEQYRGGMTTEKEAKSKIKKEVFICPEKFIDADNQFKLPRYDYEAVNVEFEEGVVQSKYHSTYYGFMAERKLIHYLYLFSQDNPENIYQKYETIGKDQIMKSQDGYFYFMKKMATCD